ncbi:haloacid dehalogenase superfamily, subfamily IA, variant 1 with third motif having Dx(3-4)D or Dx(3-4)E [Halobiforma haloterrestris]|uniref:Haloacid dehalogenase superfamily, subfamily IA, variant 1 with third motif having Dx(3-4)D or Dx(3-4)E n=1 Tax=Natronobacterium haloterrestre TaxID=148448 RepID=A0A1I1HMQ0_NATHA|nr:HAD family hydrolase [Halobiforma haloterrestris]SFC24842.1 haloacid dehalogenase superfamily, subfamily IA, variant 1 with third motif having Dx(3-4)D or Dx(3-4)E [Halobiforma haloterrestris]
MTGYDAVLFDNDGVLVDPPPVETQIRAARAAFESVGVDDPAREHVTGVVSGVTVDFLHEICATYDLDPETFWSARERHDERSQLDEFRDGTRNRYDDVDAVTDLEVPCGVVSNNHHSTVEFVLDHFGLAGAFDTYYGREMTIESLELKKPNTHYLERGLADLGVGAESALYVGDSESDVIAAERAGLESVFVRRSHCRDVDLEVTPTYEVEDLHEVKRLT